MTRITCCVALIALMGVACAQNTTGGGGEAAAPEPPPEVAFTIADQGVTDIPTDITAGINTITITNEGKDKHFPGFARINDGVKKQKVGIALAENDFDTFFTSALLAGTVFSEGKLDLLPGDTGSLTTELTEGTYILVDPEAKKFEPGYFEVGSVSDQEVEEPTADHEIVVGEYYIDMPKTLPAGPQTFSLSNAGEQSHELLIFEKKTEAEGGFAFAPLPGNVSWVEFDLKPGQYQVRCFLPDVKNGKVGKPHADLGMKASLTVE